MGLDIADDDVGDKVAHNHFALKKEPCISAPDVVLHQLRDDVYVMLSAPHLVNGLVSIGTGLLDHEDTKLAQDVFEVVRIPHPLACS